MTDDDRTLNELILGIFEARGRDDSFSEQRLVRRLVDGDAWVMLSALMWTTQLLLDDLAIRLADVGADRLAAVHRLRELLVMAPDPPDLRDY